MTKDLANYVASRLLNKLTELAIQLGLEMTDTSLVQIDNVGEFKQLMVVFTQWK